MCKTLANSNLLQWALGVVTNSYEDVDVFVETGTYHGETTLWALKHFGTVVTIDLSAEYIKAVKARRLKMRGGGRLIASSGQSPAILRRIVDTAMLSHAANRQSRYAFWLDAHGMGNNAHVGSPVLAELTQIFRLHPEQLQAVLVDDVSRMIGKNNWPSAEAVAQKLQRANMIVARVGNVFVAAPSAVGGRNLAIAVHETGYGMIVPRQI